MTKATAHEPSLPQDMQAAPDAFDQQADDIVRTSFKPSIRKVLGEN